MSLIKWTPMFESPEDMDKVFDDISPAVQGRKSLFVPAVDMYEEEKNVIVETELAGIDLDKVDISIENDVLCIRGEGEKKSEVEDKNYYRKEIRRGSFYRNIQLPVHVLGDKASAIAEDGVLRISIPKATEVKHKSIKIQTKKK